MRVAADLGRPRAEQAPPLRPIFHRVFSRMVPRTKLRFQTAVSQTRGRLFFYASGLHRFRHSVAGARLDRSSGFPSVVGAELARGRDSARRLITVRTPHMGQRRSCRAVALASILTLLTPAGPA